MSLSSPRRACFRKSNSARLARTVRQLGGVRPSWTQRSRISSTRRANDPRFAVKYSRSIVLRTNRSRFGSSFLEPAARPDLRGGSAEPSFPETSKKQGVGGLPKLVVVEPCPFNWPWQSTVAFEDSIEMSSPDMEHQLSAEPRPSYPALLTHALIDQLVHSGLDVGGCDPFAFTPSPSIVRQRADVRIEIAFEFVEALASGLNYRKVAASRVNFIAMGKKLRA